MRLVKVGRNSQTFFSLCFSGLHAEGLMVPESLHQQDSSGRPSRADFTVRPANYFCSTWPFPYRGDGVEEKSEVHFHSN